MDVSLYIYIQVLGGVTMVCFIDDDIVCENYSVAEEIYLLSNNDETGNEDDVRTN
jgi:hypothetical protein